MNTYDDQPFQAAHKIRLDSQWDLVPLPDNETPPSGLAGAQRLRHLSEYTQQAGRAAFNGRFRLVRRFGRPSGLTPTDRIELVGSGLGGATKVSLNDQTLQPLPGAGVTGPPDRPIVVRFDVSALLQDRNQLAIDVSAGAPDSDVIGDMRLEIFVGNEGAP